MSRPRILFIHGDIYAPGGAESHCLRVIELMQGRFDDITLIHAGGPLDIERIYKWCGVRLDPKRVRFISIPLYPRALRRFALITYSFANRAARCVAKDYDLILTIWAECTVKHPRVFQYVQYPLYVYSWESMIHLFGPTYTNPVMHALRWLNIVVGRAISGWNRDTVKEHATATNSIWTGKQFRRVYGDCDVKPIYIGTKVGLKQGDPKFKPFTERANNFAFIGRVVPEKRPELIVEIIRRLREQHGHDIGLHIIGHGEEPYAGKIRGLLADKPWAKWHTGLNRQELEALVASQKWGIHGNRYETYGLALVELQHLGCIVFAPDEGGQCEIVLNPALRYRDAEDAVKKIDRVLRAPGEHPHLLEEIRQSNAIHSVERFDATYLAQVEELLSR